MELCAEFTVGAFASRVSLLWIEHPFCVDFDPGTGLFV